MVPPTAMCNRTLNAPNFAPRALKQFRNNAGICVTLFANYSQTIHRMQMFDGSTKTPLHQIECWSNSLHFGSFILHCVLDYFASFAFCTNTEQHNLTWLFACSLSLPFPTYYYSLVSHELCKMFSVLANLKSHFSDWYFSCMFVVKGDLLLPRNDKTMYFSAGTWRSHVNIVTLFVDVKIT